jgi:hypothetical protein
MRAGARRIACLEIIQKSTLFLARESLTAFDGQPLADSRSELRLDFSLQWCFVLFKILNQGS